MMEPETVKNLVATTASISTILQFLTGTVVCQKIVGSKSTGDMSPFTFISGCLSTSLWLRYGFFIADRSVILVNTIGSSLFFAYVVIFYIYTLKKSMVVRQFIACLIALLIILLHVQYEESAEIAQMHLGIICSTVTVLFFAAPLASLLHVVKYKNSESLPFPIILSSFIVSAQWYLYGILLKDTYMQIPNFLGCLLSAIQLSLFCIYPRKSKDAFLEPI